MPKIPPGASSTNSISTNPISVSDRSVYVLAKLGNNRISVAPMTGPVSVPGPPTMTIINAWPDMCQKRLCGTACQKYWDKSIPAMPAITPDTMNAVNL